MLQSMLIVDDFYANGMAVREKALTLTYPGHRDGDYFPGSNSRELILPPESDRMFSSLLREPVTGNEKLSHGHCRLSLEGAERHGDIHIDDGCVWAGIIYLTLDEHARGGTEFFRHRRYGTDRAPLSEEESLRIYGTRDRVAAVNRVLNEDGTHRDRWEHVMTLPMKFNRAVLFRPWFWHTSGIDFGDSVENGRLVQLLFFKPAARPHG